MQKVAAVLAIALLVIGFILTRNPEQTAWDWPLIAAYTLFFLCIAALQWKRGGKALAVALAVCAGAAAGFDVAENLGASTTIPKWFFYFASTTLTALYFLPVRLFTAHVATLLLALGGLIGMVLSFFYPESREFVFKMVGVASGGLVFAIITLLRRS